MINKKKQSRNIFILFFAGSIIFIAIKLILDLPYRKGLPELPDFRNTSAPLKEQILDASKKTRFRPLADNIGKLGMVYHSSAYYDKAAQCYKLAAKKNKSKWLWSYYHGYLNQEMGESDKSIQHFGNVIRINPEAYHAWYYIGEGYRNLGSSFKAEIAFQKIVNLQDNTDAENKRTRIDYFSLRTHALFQLSRIYLSTNKIDLSEQTLNQILNSRRSFGPAYRLLANVYRLKGDSVLTRYHMIRANDLAEYSPPVDTLIDELTLLSKSELYLLKQIDIAERSLYPEWGLEIATQGLKHLPDNKYLISKAIKLFLKLGQGSQALPYLQKHIGLYNDDVNEILEIADLLYEKDFISQSLIYFNLAANLSPDNSKAQSGLAICLCESGMQQNAINQYTDFIERNKNNGEILADAVYLFIMVGEREKAVKYLSQLRRISGSGPEIKKFEGMIAEIDGLYEKAMVLYESSFAEDPSDLSTGRYLGNLLLKNKKWDKSIGHYRKALEYHPNEPEFLERLGNLLVSCTVTSLRDYHTARELSERAFVNKSSTPEVLISSAKSLAEAYWALGDKENARSFMTIALNLSRTQNARKEYIEELEARLKVFNSSR